MIINDKQVKILRSTRVLWEELQQLRVDLAWERCGNIKAAWSDGMPKGSGNADRMAERLIHIEKMEKREERLERNLSEARARAHYVCRDIRSSPKMRLFFEAYCVDLRSVDMAQKLSGVDNQTVRVYLKMLGEKQ